MAGKINITWWLRKQPWKNSIPFYVKWLNCHLWGGVCVCVSVWFSSRTEFQVILWMVKAEKPIFTNSHSHLPATVCWLWVLFYVSDSFIYGYPKSTPSSESSPGRLILFIPNITFVSAGFIDFMAICARLGWIASDFIETAKRRSMQATRCA